MSNTAWSTEQRHTILELWKEAVAASPDTVFLHFLDDDEKYTYAEFDELSNRLAQGLLSSGVAPGIASPCSSTATWIQSPCC